jgi:hypothetical protein
MNNTGHALFVPIDAMFFFCENDAMFFVLEWIQYTVCLASRPRVLAGQNYCISEQKLNVPIRIRPEQRVLFVLCAWGVASQHCILQGSVFTVFPVHRNILRWFVLPVVQLICLWTTHAIRIGINHERSGKCKLVDIDRYTKWAVQIALNVLQNRQITDNMYQVRHHAVTL